MPDEGDIKAAANRLRTSGWAAPVPAISKEERDAKLHLDRIGVKPRKVEPDKGFGVLDGKARQAGLWLAANIEDASYPLRPFLASKFRLSFDDAGRAVAEAERLLGVRL